MTLKMKDFEDFGWTRGCAKCVHMRRFGSSLTKHAPTLHSQQCRDRITNELAKTAAGILRIANGQARRLYEKIVENRCNFING